MKTEIIPHIEQIAVIMKMTKVDETHYRGEHGQLFRATNFGFIPENHFKTGLEQFFIKGEK